ncbi:uncharacterized oxidoreductase YtbE-like [Aricia agestis]|uniref:uncharacterized oxidoreductase YtbE-like n=1 Tax=Aricia agestis TaxID=91739 RepID=UPI001C20AB5D|nr:uncharacterized oxidoreductase YtbE-like [Aricia agestis]
MASVESEGFCEASEDVYVNYAYKKITLSNGYEMPAIGFGTYRIRESEILHGTLDAALGAGYRMFDTAAVYGNEQFLGDSLRHLLPKYGLTRQDVFITTKLSPSDHGYHNVQKALEKSLNNLGMEYVDLYLIHFPGTAKMSADNPMNQKLRSETWHAMVNMYRQGKAKCIGVSNFTVKHLIQLTDHSSIVPMVNQVEWHPYYYQPELHQYCQDNDICLQAYCSLGGTSMGNMELLEEPLVRSIATRYNVTPAQVALLWALQQDVAVIPKSVNPEHIGSNIHIKVNLSQMDLLLLDSLNKNVKYAWDPSLVA